MTKTAAGLAATAVAIAMTQGALAIDTERLAGLIEADMAIYGVASDTPLEIAIKGGDAFIAPFEANEGEASDWMQNQDCPYWSCTAVPDGMVLEAISEGEDGFAADALVVPRFEWSSFGAYFNARSITLAPVRLGEPSDQYNGLLTWNGFVDFARYRLGAMEAGALERESSAIMGPSQFGTDGQMLLSIDSVVQRTLIDPEADILYDSIAISGIESSEYLLDIWSDVPFGSGLIANLANFKIDQDWMGDGRVGLVMEADLGPDGFIRFESGTLVMTPQVYLDLMDMYATEAQMMQTLGEITVQSAILTLDLPGLAELLSSDERAMLEHWLSLAIGTEEDDAAFMDFFETGAPLTIVFDTGRPMPAAKLIEIATERPQGGSGHALMQFVRLESAGTH